jgi:hypothetical protein
VEVKAAADAVVVDAEGKVRAALWGLPLGLG